MKFFLDENFPRTALALLESAGHSAAHALQHFPAGAADALAQLGERELKNTAWLVTETRIRSRHGGS